MLLLLLERERAVTDRVGEADGGGVRRGRRERAREREVELVRIGRVEGVVGRGRVGAVVVEVRWGEPERGGHGRHVKGGESEQNWTDKRGEDSGGRRMMDGLLRNDEIFIRRTFRFGRKSGLRRRVSPVGGSFRFSISMDDASGDLQKENSKNAKNSSSNQHLRMEVLAHSNGRSSHLIYIIFLI